MLIDDYWFQENEALERVYKDSSVILKGADKVPNSAAPCKYPYYHLIGRPITPEQAKQIFAICDTGVEKYPLNHFDTQIYNALSNFYTTIFATDTVRRSWVHPNGDIWLEYHCTKYTSLEEIVVDWMVLLARFPFLDIMIAVTWWDELSPEKTKLLCDDKKHVSYEEVLSLEDKGFLEAIVWGIRIKDAVVRVMPKEEAAEEYMKCKAELPSPRDTTPPLLRYKGNIIDMKLQSQVLKYRR